MRIPVKLPWYFNRVIRNIIFWVLATVIACSGQDISRYFYYAAIMLVVFGIPGYLHNLWIIPKFLFKGKPWIYTGLLLLLLAGTTVASYYITHFVNNHIDNLNYMGANKDVAIPHHLLPTIVFIACLAFGKFASDAIESQSKMQALETRRLESELQSLKSQINPHFLFNSLNTIYGLARRTDNTTANAVLQLSDILRYVLYECDEEKITLKDEVSFLSQYIEFARLRIHKKGNIHFYVDELQEAEQKIAPLIFLPFVENAIKHGLEAINSSSVIVKIYTDGDFVHFRCINNKSVKTNNNSNSSGIGLKNVKRRLELLYPDKHELNIINNTDTFTVELKILLT